MIRIPEGKFRLGQVVATPGALEALQEANQQAWEFLAKHVVGNWGEINQEDWQLNDASLEDGSRVLSAYRTKNDVKLWIITEADRSSTTILLPDEY